MYRSVALDLHRRSCPPERMIHMKKLFLPKKRLLVAFICVFTCVALMAACGGDPSDSTGTTVSDDAAVTTEPGETGEQQTGDPWGGDTGETLPPVATDDTSSEPEVTTPEATTPEATQPEATQPTQEATEPEKDEEEATKPAEEVTKPTEEDKEEPTQPDEDEDDEDSETSGGEQISGEDDEEVADLGWENINVDEFFAEMGIDIDDLEVND